MANTVAFPEVTTEDNTSAAVIILRILYGLSEESQLVTLQSEKRWSILLAN